MRIARTDMRALRPSPGVNSALNGRPHSIKLARSYHSPAAFGFARWAPPALGTQQVPLEQFFVRSVPAEAWAPISFSRLIGL